jgi:hypothetical protein
MVRTSRMTALARARNERFEGVRNRHAFLRRGFKALPRRLSNWRSICVK